MHLVCIQRAENRAASSSAQLDAHSGQLLCYLLSRNSHSYTLSIYAKGYIVLPCNRTHIMGHLPMFDFAF